MQATAWDVIHELITTRVQVQAGSRVRMEMDLPMAVGISVICVVILVMAYRQYNAAISRKKEDQGAEESDTAAVTAAAEATKEQINENGSKPSDADSGAVLCEERVCTELIALRACVGPTVPEEQVP